MRWRVLPSALGAMCAAGFALVFASAAYATPDAPHGGVVGTGTPASCTSYALDQRLIGGGTVTFNCGLSPHTIVLTTSKSITLNTIVDGGGLITLSGNNLMRVFNVSGASLTLRNIVLERGVEDGLGGCVFSGSASTLIAITTTFRLCSVTFSMLGSPMSGGAIYGSDNVTMTLTNTHILTNTANRHGGGLYLLSGTLSYVGGSVANNIARGLTGTFSTSPLALGGGMYVGGGSVVISGVNFISNTALTTQGAGGGAYFDDGVGAMLTNTSFQRNVVADSGGGLYASGGTLNQTGGSFLNNSAAFGGGQATSSESVVQSSVVVSGNFASSDGGGAYVDSGTLAQTNVAYTGNVGLSSGGAIFSFGNLQQTGVSFARNVAGLEGGGVYENGGNLRQNFVTYTANSASQGGGLFGQVGDYRLTNANFTNNTATDSGGGLYAYNNLFTTLVVLTDTTFQRNLARNNGGGLAVLYAGLVMNGGSVMTNVVSATTGTNGGGAYVVSGTANISGTSFVSNTAYSSLSLATSGGGLHAENGARVTLTATQFVRNTARYGGGTHNDDASLKMVGGSMSQNSAFLGGAMLVSDDETTQLGVSMTDNTATQGGAAEIDPASWLTQTGVVMTGNFAYNYGGALFSHGHIRQFGATLTQNATDFDGGAVYVSAGTFSADNTKFFTNTAGRDGGAVFVFTALDVSANNSEFISNTAVTNGGGVYVRSGRANLIGGKFQRNVADTRGGGAFFTGTLPITVTGTLFDANAATDYGGGIANHAPATRIVNAVFTQNRAQLGALNSASRAPEAVITSGGGIYNSGNLTDSGSLLQGNSADSNGGGIYNDATGAMTQDSSRIISNTANFGGGVANRGALTQTQVTLAQNSADFGGGLYQTSDGQESLWQDRVSFTSNTASNNGGGLYLSNGAATLDRLSVRNNVANGDGGGARVVNASVSLMRSTLDGNTANRGGGIESSSDDVTIAQSTLSNNSAVAFGGGIRSSGRLNLINSTLSANTAITGGGIMNRDNVTLTNVTLSGNSATDGGGIFNEDAPTHNVVLKNVIVANSPSGGDCKGKAISSSKYSIASDATCALAGTGDLNGTNPLLGALQYNGGATKTHLPLTGSPAIDHVVGSDAPSSDQRGAPRPLDGDGVGGAAYDTGAVEVGADVPNDLAHNVFAPNTQRAALSGW